MHHPRPKKQSIQPFATQHNISLEMFLFLMRVCFYRLTMVKN